MYPVPQMKVKEFRWLFIAVFTAFVVSGFVFELPTMGVSAEWVDGRYRFAGGTLFVLVVFGHSGASYPSQTPGMAPTT